jgi:hypothetical protein
MKTAVKPTQKLLPFIYNAIALAAGIAVVVLSFLHALTFDTQAALLGLGVTLLAFASLSNQSPRTQAGQE